ncbi:MAG: CDP-alcohol phosphatidyltransferase family protein, partial [Spirochaetota bacterium]|nr:CDP-alcohol phosphatidyltransferase family protein [Spirochaetota bacterium]
VTFISILLSMLSAALFYKAEFLYGAIFYWLSYVFDCVDGSVARLTSKFSQLGHVLDHSFDRIRTFLCLLAILFNNGIIHSELVLPLFLYYFSNSFLIYINRIYLDIRNIKINHKKDYRKKNIYLNKKILSKNFTKYRITNYLINILSKRKINLFPTDVEGDALIFIFGSITKDIDLFCYISSTLLLIASLLTIYKSIKI